MTTPNDDVAIAVHGEPFWQTVNKIICEESAWIGCPNKAVAARVAFAALVKATMITDCTDNPTIASLEARLAKAEAERDAAVAQTERAIANGWQGIETASNAMVQVAKRYQEGIAEGERRATAAIVAWLGKASIWLNGGECCGMKDSDGVCCAPACEWGEELKLLHKLADAIEAGDHLTEAKP
jgi:hypothetical protein